MATAEEKAEAKLAFSTKTVARRTIAAWLADGMFTDDYPPLLREDELLEEMGIVPGALSPAQRERYVEAVDYVAGRLDVMAGRPKPE